MTKICTSEHVFLVENIESGKKGLWTGFSTGSFLDNTNEFKN